MKARLDSLLGKLGADKGDSSSILFGSTIGNDVAISKHMSAAADALGNAAKVVTAEASKTKETLGGLFTKLGEKGAAWISFDPPTADAVATTIKAKFDHALVTVRGLVNGRP
mmetsp:Transcript_10237/g.33665  ORF Transcript_10237/g.33665 Transcript_10237/m.33665 type:complete len:112 (+) Transcript_10237:341-676(+)